MKPKKVVFALDSFFPRGSGGTEVYVSNLAIKLISKGYTVSVVVPSIEEVHDKNDHYQYKGIDVYIFQVSKTPVSEEINGLIPPKGINEFLKTIIYLNPDIVHFHSFNRAINTFHLEAVAKLNIKTVFTPHLADVVCVKQSFKAFDEDSCDGIVQKNKCLACYIHQDKSLQKKMAVAFSFAINTLLDSALKPVLPASFNIINHRVNELNKIQKYCSKVVVLTKWMEQVLIRNEIDNISVVYQGISDIFVTEKSCSPKRIQKTIKICFIGRMHPIKGFHLLKEAFTKISSHKFALHVITMASGEEDEYHQSMRNWAFGRDDVFWQENFSQQEVSEYLEKMDVLCLPSIVNEMAPLVIQEAFAKNVPVIGSNSMGISEMVNHDENGLIFKLGDPIDLYNKLSILAESPWLLERFRASIKRPRTFMEVSEELSIVYSSL